MIAYKSIGEDHFTLHPSFSCCYTYGWSGIHDKPYALPAFHENPSYLGISYF